MTSREGPHRMSTQRQDPRNNKQRSKCAQKPLRISGVRSCKIWANIFGVPSSEAFVAVRL